MGVLIINHKSVGMAHALTGIDSAVRVGVPGGQVRVVVLDHVRVLCRPEARSHPHGPCACDAQHHKRRSHPEAGTEPAGQGIEHQPAGVRQRELRGKQSRAIFWVR